MGETRGQVCPRTGWNGASHWGDRQERTPSPQIFQVHQNRKGHSIRSKRHSFGGNDTHQNFYKHLFVKFLNTCLEEIHPTSIACIQVTFEWESVRVLLSTAWTFEWLLLCVFGSNVSFHGGGAGEGLTTKWTVMSVIPFCMELQVFLQGILCSEGPLTIPMSANQIGTTCRHSNHLSWLQPTLEQKRQNFQVSPFISQEIWIQEKSRHGRHEFQFSIDLQPILAQDIWSLATKRLNWFIFWGANHIHKNECIKLHRTGRKKCNKAPSRNILL